MRILLIENDPASAPVIELMLKAEGFNVYTTDEGAEGIDLAKLYDYDAVLLSTTPDRADIDMVRSIRLEKVRSSIVVLTSTPTIERTVQLLGTGADDVISKPFHKDELVARILATVRRSKGHAQSIITVGDLVVNVDTKTATVAGNPVHLTGKEYAMLELMALRKNNVLTKEVILNALYGGMDEPELKIIDVFVCKLRKKLAAVSGGQSFVETIWGRGYCLRDGETTKAAAPLASNPVGRTMEGIDALPRRLAHI
jgi:two-component system cell cycle response regulator CtrA